MHISIFDLTFLFINSDLFTDLALLEREMDGAFEVCKHRPRDQQDFEGHQAGQIEHEHLVQGAHLIMYLALPQLCPIMHRQ